MKKIPNLNFLKKLIINTLFIIFLIIDQKIIFII